MRMTRKKILMISLVLLAIISLGAVSAADDVSIDDAQVLLSISTGLVENIIMYAIGVTIILAVLAGGIMGIKKFVL